MPKSTAQNLLDAALATLAADGYADSTTRAIAARAGVNPALVHYHFGTVENLLVAALEEQSLARLARYRSAVDAVQSLEELVPVMAGLWDEDKASGMVRALAQLTAGAVNRPELAARLVELMDPWVAFAEDTVARLFPAALPHRELAFAIVTFYLGANLMTSLGPAQDRVDELFRAARDASPLLAALSA